MKMICTVCKTDQSRGYAPVCKKCGGLTNPVYELNKVTILNTDNPYVRFSDLLPIQDKGLLPPDAGYTPAIHAKNLGRLLGMPHLYLKNETVLPTGTTKYRMASIALPYLYEKDVKHFCTSSTGNSSTAYASLIGRFPELEMTLFTASDFQHRISYDRETRINHFILSGASFTEAFDTSAKYARLRGYTSESGFFNPGRREGLKLAFFEASDQIPRQIDLYVQAISSAMGVFGTFSGAKELLALSRISRLPRLLCVQQSSCAPMAHAWSEGSTRISTRHIVENPRGVADAILRGNPSRAYPYVSRIVRESGGDITAVSETRIRQARRLLSVHEGIDVCYSAATALAGLVRLATTKRVSSEETILVNLTGSDRPPAQNAGGYVFHKTNGEWRCDERPFVTFATVGDNKKHEYDEQVL